jgi:hypothetical protein
MSRTFLNPSVLASSRRFRGRMRMPVCTPEIEQRRAVLPIHCVHSIDLANNDEMVAGWCSVSRLQSLVNAGSYGIGELELVPLRALGEAENRRRPVRRLKGSW